MRSLFLLLCLFVFPNRAVSAQDAAPDTSQAVIDSVYTLIKSQSLFRDNVDWAQVDSTFDANVETRDTFAEKLETFRDVFGALGDVHSAIYYAGRGIAYRPESSTRDKRDVNSLIMLSREKANKPEGSLLPGGIGYVYVPAYAPGSPDEMNADASKLRGLICDLAPKAVNGWVIDLRVNEGGNIHPMLSGLGDLLGDGPVARSVGASGETQFEWSIVEGALSIGGYQAITADQRCPEASGSSIAVLIGPATLSSGQVTAVAFAGWDRARLFGDPTAEGYATNNYWHQITADLALNLSTAFFADRSGYVHEGTVVPDELVDEDWQLENPLEDPVVQTALNWLLQQ